MESLRDLLATVLEGLAAGRVPPGTTDRLVRALAAHHRAAQTAGRALHHPAARDDGSLPDDEETPPALHTRLLEARATAEGFVEALALLVTSEFAAAVDSAALAVAATDCCHDGVP